MIALWVLLAQAGLPSPAPLPPPNAAAGEAVFAKACTQCHGPDGKGRTAFGRDYHVPDFTSEAWQKGISDAQIVRVITDGKREKGMIPFGDRLRKEEIAALVPYLRAFGRAQK